MTALSEGAPKVLAYDSLNSTLAETGWRMELGTDEAGREKILYFPLTEAEFLHPQEGYHLPSNTFHGTAQRDLIDILQRRYAQREDVGVFGDLIIKWGIKGLGNHCPDVCVVFELKNKGKNRESFLVAKEGTKPVVVMEVVSPRYRKTDRETKVKEYARAGVEEYIIIDRRPQRGELIDEVIGYRLEEGGYMPITPDEEGRIYCQALNVWMGMLEGKVMLFEGATGEPLPTSQGLEQLAEQERQRAEQEYQRAQRLAERLHQLGINPDEV